MSMLYATATGQYVMSLATALWMAIKATAIGAILAALASLFTFKGVIVFVGFSLAIPFL